MALSEDIIPRPKPTIIHVRRIVAYWGIHDRRAFQAIKTIVAIII